MKSGVTRLVLIIGRYVVKIPNFTVQHDHFLMGCVANWNERKRWKMYKDCEFMPHKDLVVPSSFCMWFGLLQIQHKAKVRDNSDHLSYDEVMMFKDITSDTKAANFGYYQNRLVCLDYG